MPNVIRREFWRLLVLNGIRREFWHLLWLVMATALLCLCFFMLISEKPSDAVDAVEDLSAEVTSLKVELAEIKHEVLMLRRVVEDDHEE